MKNKSIIFTKPRTAEVLETELGPVEGDLVQVKMDYTVISGGTERACILGMPNTNGGWPHRLGYCGVGTVAAVGEAVEKIAVGDRVLVYHGHHSQYNLQHEAKITKVECDAIDSLEAAFVVIASMGLGGVRKLELELGESAMVMGLGLLGIFALQFLRLSGANPLIAADLNPERRALALKLGADYALDPSAEDFVEQVKEITKGKGVNATVEVTGVSAAMKQALECASWMGRISLLGCTRVSDCAVDYYQQVHRPGIKLIGAHNFVRPKVESYPHHWTHQDDCKAILELIERGRLDVKSVVSRVVPPETAPEIYTELCDNPNFPLGTVFDWRTR
ncbi:MAG: zinc-binding alcohol dehydrogenase [Clostridia bacterium]|nr:zinc-binding alcohol dehydrogenase [Clostridia bacterium]